MESLFPVLIILALLITLGVLFAGVLSMGRGGPEAPARSNRLMRWRVIMQAIAIGLIALAILAS